MRCEGWERTGGMMTLGPVDWKQCENEAVVMLKVEQKKTQKLPGCMKCWQKCIDEKVKILSAEPIS